MMTPGLAPEVLRAAVQHDPFWDQHIQRVLQPGGGKAALHLAILVNPYLRLILSGKKTIESRFSIQRRTPFDQVQPGDVVLFKRSGGPILGIGTVDQARYFELNPQVLQEIQTAYAAELCIDDPAFWQARASAGFATLLWLQHVSPITPIPFVKRDQRAWVVLKRRLTQPSLWAETAPASATPPLVE